MITNDDILLRHCLADKIESLDISLPYVWQLKLSQCDFHYLHHAIKASIASHAGDIAHLLTADYARHIIVYLAEWYKRCYSAGNAEDKAIDLNTEQLKTLWRVSGINIDKYVYATADGSRRLWQYSIYVLGGLAIRYELGKTDDRFLRAICRVLHGENPTLENISDESRAVAFRSSIAMKHSLYEFLTEIVNNKFPFSEEDAHGEARMLVERIRNANDEVLKQKFRFEWVVNYDNGYSSMQRQLRLWLNPEMAGEGLHHYLRYDRMLLWGFKDPGKIERLFVSLRFLDGDKIIDDLNFKCPIISYVNTGEEYTGFVAMGVKDFGLCHNVPAAHFTKIEIWACDNEGNSRCIQEYLCKEYMQLWRVSPYEDEWTSRPSVQKETAVVFSKSCRILADELNAAIALLPFRNRKFGNSANYGWCDIYDRVTIEDEQGSLATLYNRTGYYSISTKLYRDSICYAAGGTVKHISESDDIDFDATEELLPLIFGKSDIAIYHFETKDDAKNELVESIKQAEAIVFKVAGHWEKWTGLLQPEYGVLDLRITVQGRQLPYRVFYMPAVETEHPIVRDFKAGKILYSDYCNGVVEQQEIQDTFDYSDTPTDPTITIQVGNSGDYAEIQVFRPTLVKEICRDGVVVKRIHNGGVLIPYILKDILSVNCFTEYGFQTYCCGALSSIFSHLSNTDSANFQLAAWEGGIQIPATTLDYYAPSCLKVWLGDPNHDSQDVKFFHWNYWESTEPVECDYSPSTDPNTVIFQSMAEQRSIDCVVPVRGGFSVFKYKKQQISAVKCFDVALQHGIYFFILLPLTKISDYKAELYEPLLAARGGVFSEEDKKGLLRLAEEFNFDWQDYKIDI